MIWNRIKQALTITTIAVTMLPAVSLAQDSVFIYKADGKPGKSNGKITAADPEGVTIDGKKIPSASIRKITIGREPTALGRARDNFENGQYADCIQQLDRLDPPPRQPLLVADIDFMRAYSNAQMCLLGGNMTPDVASRKMEAFLQKHPSSYHAYPALECYGRLAFALGKPDVAAPVFQKLHSADWTEYRLKGLFYYGKMMELTNQASNAIQSYDVILNESGNDDFTQSFKGIASIEKTKLEGIGGNQQAAIDSLRKMLSRDASDKRLYGYLNNALGALYQAKGDMKNAMMAYLKTQLLCGSAEGPHSEALFRLTKIWPDLKDNGRANEARDILQSTYRNSYWSKKL